ncbi:hypothetical protein CNR22_16800 [Sphingobacteriaceae bacterium]|nr:hypothetical protein CNR22_16800 [Sphingobacteriaceae bacterium]
MRKRKIFYVLLLTAFLFSCKKGEKDPFLSLSTRKARLEGDWKLVKGHLKFTYEKDGNTLYEDNSTLTEDYFTSVNDLDGSTLEGKYKLQISFTKDGDFSFLQLIESNTVSGNGTWDFLRASGKYKNKERVSFKPNAIGGGSYWMDAFNKSVNYFIYEISELRKDKMVLKVDKEVLDVNSKDGITCYVTSEYTFAQK